MLFCISMAVTAFCFSMILFAMSVISYSKARREHKKMIDREHSFKKWFHYHMKTIRQQNKSIRRKNKLIKRLRAGTTEEE